MRKIKTVIKSVLMFFLLINGLLLAQESRKPDDREKTPTRSQSEEKERAIPTEKQVLNMIDKDMAMGDNDIASQNMSYHLRSLIEFVDKIKSQKIADKIMAIPEYESFNEEYPRTAYEVLCAKLDVLRYFEEFKGVRDYMIKHLNHKSSTVQVVTARTLLLWGDWDMAAPVICKNEAYLVFQQYRDERAIPLLEEAARNGSWQGRMLAAAALFYTYGDSTKYPEVALDVIMNAPINTDDENTNRAKYLALAQVPRFGLVNALPGLIRLAQDTAAGISLEAVIYLIDLSGMGYGEATRALIDIKDNHFDGEIRAMAKHGLLEQEQK